MPCYWMHGVPCSWKMTSWGVPSCSRHKCRGLKAKWQEAQHYFYLKRMKSLRWTPMPLDDRNWIRVRSGDLGHLSLPGLCPVSRGLTDSQGFGGHMRPSVMTLYPHWLLQACAVSLRTSDWRLIWNCRYFSSGVSGPLVLHSLYVWSSAPRHGEWVGEEAFQHKALEQKIQLLNPQTPLKAY